MITKLLGYYYYTVSPRRVVGPINGPEKNKISRKRAPKLGKICQFRKKVPCQKNLE